ncbi:peptidoglycan-associated lipoprotein Pal [Echinimonas agarilytica]|uniref:Peptidoglycan-associated lipoprotein n=1 Tax=Echinimonas agarilytica TaxID=1215918 RepID=A0AA41W6F0_9GAMM|nr:peptidoglycan-associated lipoprotein Pal [Echinimonas agarilytica]MCM2679700.1 peptidoglycan-associated lipoprotein Pal [Echinimonas agarilytica]
MQLKPLTKGLMLALPLMVLAACSSTDDNAAGSTDDSAITGTATPMLTPEEERMQRYAEMRKEHIIYFDFDRSDVRGEFAELLAAHADYLVKNPGVSVRVEGHADERGTPEYNIALGERRAKAVTNYLMSLGVLASQISTVSYGEEMPLVAGHNDEAWSKNRRAVLVY